MKIKITADSTCDLSAQLVEQYNVGIMPLHVTLGDNDHLDGVDITPEDIYEFYAENKALPKSGCRTEEEYYDFFKGFIDEGYDGIVHYNLSSDMSGSYSNAYLASKRLTNVHVVDSRSLSTGTGLLVLDACDMANNGMAAADIAARSVKRVPSVQASFILDKLEFLYKGGRCSSLEYLGANLLQIKPMIFVKNGVMGVGKKPFGKYKRCVDKYVAEIREQFATPDKKRCFVTHTKMDGAITERVIEAVRSWGIFDEIIETTAGCTITTHCGANTIGILFINDGGIEQ